MEIGTRGYSMGIEYVAIFDTRLFLKKNRNAINEYVFL